MGKNKKKRCINKYNISDKGAKLIADYLKNDKKIMDDKKELCFEIKSIGKNICLGGKLSGDKMVDLLKWGIESYITSRQENNKVKINVLKYISTLSITIIGLVYTALSKGILIDSRLEFFRLETTYLTISLFSFLGTIILYVIYLVMLNIAGNKVLKNILFGIPELFFSNKNDEDKINNNEEDFLKSYIKEFTFYVEKSTNLKIIKVLNTIYYIIFILFLIGLIFSFAVIFNYLSNNI